MGRLNSETLHVAIYLRDMVGIDLHIYLQHGEKINKLYSKLRSLPKLSRKPEPGDFAYATTLENPMISIVLKSGKYTALIDIDGKNCIREFVTDKISILDLISIN